MRIGVVSDTHGLFRPQLPQALAGVDHILHLGDVGKIEVLDELRKIAPVSAVRGNIDREGACAELPATDVVLFEGRYLYLLHDLNTIRLDPAAARFAAVLSGHTHVPNISTRRGVLYINPGSCGPRRFKLLPTLAILTVPPHGEVEEELEVQMVSLDAD
ncbi:MAG: metallophosphoesterase family protein [Terracidiphilus sp.]